MNDGIYCNNIESLAKLKDEDFSGCIWEMSVPPDFIELCSDIDEWRKKNETAESTNMSPFISESFGGYSYSKIVGNTGSAGGNTVSWQEQFRKRLNIWRKI